MQSNKKKAMQRIVCGGFVGLANGIFGGGGGMIAVPLLKRTGMAEKQAHATAIAVILPVSLLSFLLYFFHGYYQADVLIPTSLGVTLGGFIGAKLLGKLSIKSVQLLFAALQLLAGIFLFIF